MNKSQKSLIHYRNNSDILTQNTFNKFNYNPYINILTSINPNTSNTYYNNNNNHVQLGSIQQQKLNLESINNINKITDVEEFGTYISRIKSNREKIQINREYKFDDLDKFSNNNLNKITKSKTKENNWNTQFKHSNSILDSTTILKSRKLLKSKSFDIFLFEKHKTNFLRCQFKASAEKNSFLNYYKDLLIVRKDNKFIKNEKQKISINFFQRKQSITRNVNSNLINITGNQSTDQTNILLNHSQIVNSNNNSQILNNLKLNSNALSNKNHINNYVNNKSNLLSKKLTIASDRLFTAEKLNQKINLIDVNKFNFKNISNHKQQPILQLNNNYTNESRHLKNASNQFNANISKDLSISSIYQNYKLQNAANKSYNINEQQNSTLSINQSNIGCNNNLNLNYKETNSVSKKNDNFLLSNSERKKNKKDELTIKFGEEKNDEASISKICLNLGISPKNSNATLNKYLESTRKNKNIFEINLFSSTSEELPLSSQKEESKSINSNTTFTNSNTNFFSNNNVKNINSFPTNYYIKSSDDSLNNYNKSKINCNYNPTNPTSPTNINKFNNNNGDSSSSSTTVTNFQLNNSNDKTLKKSILTLNNSSTNILREFMTNRLNKNNTKVEKQSADNINKNSNLNNSPKKIELDIIKVNNKTLNILSKKDEINSNRLNYTNISPRKFESDNINIKKYNEPIQVIPVINLYETCYNTSNKNIGDRSSVSINTIINTNDYIQNVNATPKSNKKSATKIIRPPETTKKVNNEKVFIGDGKQNKFLLELSPRVENRPRFKIFNHEDINEEKIPLEILTNKNNNYTPNKNFESTTPVKKIDLTPENTPFKFKVNILDKLLYNEKENTNIIDQKENNRLLKLKISPENDKKRKELFSERLITNEKINTSTFVQSPVNKKIKTSRINNFHNIIKNNLTLLQSSSSNILNTSTRKDETNSSIIKEEADFDFKKTFKNFFFDNNYDNYLQSNNEKIEKLNINTFSDVIINNNNKNNDISEIQKKNNHKKNNLDTIILNNKTCNSNSNSHLNTKDNFYYKEKSDDEYLFSSDEKTQITSVPLFNIKKLETYNFSTKDKENSQLIKKNSINIKSYTKVNQFLIYESFCSLLKYHSKIKDNILTYMNYREVLNLSLTSKFIRKETIYKIYFLSINMILDENNYFIMRIKIWKSIYKYSELNKVKYLKKEYLDNLYKKSKYEDDIKKDLNRTFPDDPLFKIGKTNYKKLFNILIAYSNYNPKMGYAQGLNFIVANAILVLNEEEEVFIFIDSLINKYDFNNLIGVKNISLSRKLDELGNLIKRYIPDLVQYLDENYLNHEFFTTNWIITLFSNSIKKLMLLKIWDLFLIYGWKFLNYFIISILMTFKDNIMDIDPSSLSVYMKNLLKSDLFDHSFPQIVSRTFDTLKNINKI